MNAKKWVLTFLLFALVLVLGLAAFNYVTDPFAAFGDKFLNWFSYDETNNPRVAKISYLEQHHDEYDSYILGCSSTSSLQVSDFNKLYDANFYNLIMYGADMRDCEKIADYLIEHYEVKHLVLNVYLDNGFTYDDETDRLTRNLHYLTDPDTSALSFYTRYLFCDPRYRLYCCCPDAAEAEPLGHRHERDHLLLHEECGHAGRLHHPLSQGGHG